MPRPVRVGCERELIEVVGRIHAAARVGVVQPGAADGGVLFDDHERNAQRLELDGRAQPRFTGADDQHLETFQRFRSGTAAPGHFQRCGAGKAHFVTDHRHVFLRHWLADTHRQHAMQQFARGRRCGRAPARGDVRHGCGQLFPQRLPERRRHAFHEVPRPVDMRRDFFQGVGVAGELHIGHQQRRDVRLGEPVAAWRWVVHVA